MHTIIWEISRQQVTLCGILSCFFVTMNSTNIVTPIRIPMMEISSENDSNSGKKSDGCKLVKEIIFAEINIIGPLMNVQATILLAIKSTSVSYFVAITNAPGAEMNRSYSKC